MCCVPLNLNDQVVLTATMTDAPPRAAKASPAWAALPREVLNGGEIVLLAIKPSMWRPAADSLPWLVVCVGLAAVMLMGRTTIPGLSVSISAQIVLLIAAVRLALAIVRWVPTWYVLTNRRILTIHGVRAPQYASSLLTDIRDTQVHISPTDKLARMGSILFVSRNGEEVTHIWRSIPQPTEVHQRVRRAIRDALDNHMS